MLFKSIFAITMMAILLCLTTANYWIYKIKKEKDLTSIVNDAMEEESESASSKPFEEKKSNLGQVFFNYSGNYCLIHPTTLVTFGNRHDIFNYPTQHLELITPPPKEILF